MARPAGQSARAIAAEFQLDGRTVTQWLKRFGAGGLAALEDAPRRGRPATCSPEERAEVVAAALRFSLAYPRWHYVCQPTYAACLNRIEPWCKTLRALAFKGGRFEDWPEMTHAVAQATAYCNAHRHPFHWGRRGRHHPRRPPGCARVPLPA